MSMHSRLCAYIDLDAIRYNFDQMHDHIADGTMMAAVIKADGYGHGAVPIARMLEKKNYIWGYAVAAVEEAVELREAGLRKPIMLLGYTFPEDYATVIAHDVMPCIFTMEMARAYSDQAVLLKREVRVHIKIDSGMNRIGFKPTERSLAEILNISELPNLKIEGVFTHFARADEVSDEATDKQFETFSAFVDKIKACGVEIPIVHASNSAAIIKYPKGNLDMVRAGISLYGLSPSEEVPHTELDLKSAMSIVSHVSHVKTLEAGEAISYGGTYVTDQRRVIATIPAGYADGYPRSLSNKGYVLIHGQKAPVTGRVCMDQFMVDVTAIEGVKTGDEAVLLGRQGDQIITAEMLGDLSGRFNYELVCDINKRVPRVYHLTGDND
ncbi:MAG: alanine racemase [Lachnospiraceae bacterium]|nr:alanine racemase [Candidatus Equihabitans merdae]